MRSEEAGTREPRAEAEEKSPLPFLGGDSEEEVDKSKSPNNRSAHLVEKQTAGLREEEG